ncbi:MAG: hypothetical protein E4H03_04070, partial [Myxococcales bacterium]
MTVAADLLHEDHLVDAGLGALSFSFLSPEEARGWVKTYYDIIESEQCVPLGHSVNANMAVVTG